MSINAIEGEVGRVVNFHLRKGDGTDFDLTGATISFHIGSNTTGLACTITDAGTGKAAYTSAANELTEGLGQEYRIKIVNAPDTFFSRFGTLNVEKTFPRDK